MKIRCTYTCEVNSWSTQDSIRCYVKESIPVHTYTQSQSTSSLHSPHRSPIITFLLRRRGVSYDVVWAASTVSGQRPCLLVLYSYPPERPVVEGLDRTRVHYTQASRLTSLPTIHAVDSFKYSIKSLRSLAFFRPAKTILVPLMYFFGSFR